MRFNSEGTKKFDEVTARNIGRPVAIFLDEFPVTFPRVQENISTGEAIITGEFTLDEAKKLSIQLNAGALPVAIELIEQRSIGATLGAEVRQKKCSRRGDWIGDGDWLYVDVLRLFGCFWPVWAW